MSFNVNLPVCAWREWNTRYKDAFYLIDARFPGEMRVALKWTRPLTERDMDPEAYKRSFRLLSFLSLSGFDGAENVFQQYQQTEPMGETHGYEALRRVSLELSIKSRGELVQFKEKFMSLSVGKGTRVMDIVRRVETQASQYAQVLAGSAFSGDMSLVLQDADQVVVTMRLLPDQHVQLHGSYGSFAEVRAAAFGTGLHVHAVQGRPRGSRAGSRDSEGGGRGRASSRDRDRGGKPYDRGDRGGSSTSPSPSKRATGGCWNYGDPNHLSRDLSETSEMQKLRSRRATLPKTVHNLRGR